MEHKKMNKLAGILLWIILCLLESKSAFADEQRFQTKFTSQNKQYSIEITKGNKWRLKNQQGKVLYSIKDERFTSMTMQISDDGKSVVVVDDFSETGGIGRMKALWFFHNGELKKSYQLKELVNDTCNVSHSIWHTMWCLHDFGFLSNDSVFQLSTYEFYDFKFDIQTGNLISKLRPEEFTSETIIVYGSFRKGKREEATLKVAKYIINTEKTDSTIKFRTKYHGEGQWNEVLMIKEGEDVTPLKYKYKGIYIGGCDK